MPEITSKYTSESGHWYTEDGKPAYAIIGKNGVERNTTLRDARKMGLKPSVTTILKEANKPGLQAWIQKQVLMAALTLPMIAGESEDAYIARIMEDSKQQAIKAAERGNQVHAWVQQGFEDKLTDADGEIYFHVALQEIEKECGIQKWECESSFSTDKYGGKVDLCIPEIVLDIKAKDVPLEGLKTWDDHDMQIGAYREGKGYPTAKGGILFISTKDISAKLIWIPEEKLQRGTTMFNRLVDYWYAKTGL